VTAITLASIVARIHTDHIELPQHSLLSSTISSAIPRPISGKRDAAGAAARLASMRSLDPTWRSDIGEARMGILFVMWITAR
jgi:hypothetical protein